MGGGLGAYDSKHVGKGEYFVDPLLYVLTYLEMGKKSNYVL